MHNRILLAKWLWRFGMEIDGLCYRVVVERFGEEAVWKSRRVRDRHGCGIWKSIMVGNKDFWKYVRFKLGSKDNISLWSDL